jgi:hypothetical protein
MNREVYVVGQIAEAEAVRLGLGKIYVEVLLAAPLPLPRHSCSCTIGRSRVKPFASRLTYRVCTSIQAWRCQKLPFCSMCSIPVTRPDRPVHHQAGTGHKKIKGPQQPPHHLLRSSCRLCSTEASENGTACATGLINVSHMAYTNKTLQHSRFEQAAQCAEPATASNVRVLSQRQHTPHNCWQRHQLVLAGPAGQTYQHLPPLNLPTQVRLAACVRHARTPPKTQAVRYHCIQAASTGDSRCTIREWM